MGKNDKLIQKIRLAQNFTYDEAVNLLCSLGYEVSNKGKTSGSRVVFKCEGRASIYLHKPHPQKELIDTRYEKCQSKDPSCNYEKIARRLPQHRLRISVFPRSTRRFRLRKRNFLIRSIRLFSLFHVIAGPQICSHDEKNPYRPQTCYKCEHYDTPVKTGVFSPEFFQFFHHNFDSPLNPLYFIIYLHKNRPFSPSDGFYLTTWRFRLQSSLPQIRKWLQMQPFQIVDKDLIFLKENQVFVSYL